MARSGKEAFSEKITEKICEHIRMGSTYEVAARAAGIDVRTLYEWRKKGEAATDGEYYDFWKQICEAEAQSEALHARQITCAATEKKTRLERKVVTQADGTVVYTETEKEELPDWRASQYLLVARFPERWSPNRLDPRLEKIIDAIDWEKVRPEYLARIVAGENVVDVAVSALLEGKDDPPNGGEDNEGSL